MTQNPWDSLENPELKAPATDYFGQVKIDTYFCVLVKGMGKMPFDPAQYSEDQKRTAVEIQILPLAEQNISYDLSRSMIAESREWAGTVLPSIKALGIPVAQLADRYVRVRTKGLGTTYTNNNGETRERTTFEFVAIYPDEAACRAAYQAYAAGDHSQSAPPPPVNGNGNKERETALKFLKVIVENAVKGQSDLGVISNTVAANIANMPMIAKYFTAQSPEAMQMIAEAMSK